jgi:hypothetical protein
MKTKTKREMEIEDKFIRSNQKYSTQKNHEKEILTYNL